MNGILHSIYTKDGTNCFRLNLSGEIDVPWTNGFPEFRDSAYSCLLYTSDAADE